MAKEVVYNGEILGCERCSDSSKLKEGQVYEVTSVCERGIQTLYTLKGIEGEFNSIWFNEIPKIYFAISCEVPETGKQLKNFKRFEKEKGWIQIKRTSEIQYVAKIGVDVYKMYTQNTLYLVQIV